MHCRAALGRLKSHMSVANQTLGPGRVLVTRGQSLDAWHAVSVAVTDASGRLRRRTGDSELVTFARSSIKAFQALPLLTSGAADRFQLTQQELAIVQASHNGTDEHVRWVQELLSKSGSTAAQLGCGAHLPLFMQLQKLWPTRGEDRDPLRHNCSGKHAGFLLLAQHLGVSPERYLDGACSLQVAVKSAIAEHTGVDPSQLSCGTDGCSAPNYAMPLSALARAFARYAAADSDSPLGRLKLALQAHPELVSGQGQFDLDLMAALPGRVVCKGGAEGIMGIGLVDLGLGVVVKVHDGNPRALAPACLAVLSQLGVFEGGLPPTLLPHQRPQVHNARGTLTGELVAEIRLE